MPARALLLLVLLPSLARAQMPPPDPRYAARPRSSNPALAQALDRFDFGDFEAVVSTLRPLVESGGDALPAPADRIEALRTYGIACTLTGRRTAAEGAFLLLLRADPTTRLDPMLVRPEAVAFFEQVRARYREELLASYRKGRQRRYLLLNFLPPGGQLQNRQRNKAIAIGALEVPLIATSLVTGVLAYSWKGDGSFPDHRDAAPALVTLNWVSFALAVLTVGYGVLDGLVVGRRLAREEADVARSLRASMGALAPGL